MPYQLIRNDITKMRVDAIVNPTDSGYSGRGGTDAQIHRAAGLGLRRACDALPPLEDGAVAVTGAYDLPCRYVIHTVGPVWRGGNHHERETLIACYRNALYAAADRQCASIAFPLIAAGTFSYPKDRVLRVALETIGEFLMTHDMTVYVVVFDKESYSISKKLQADIDSFIDENYIATRSLFDDSAVLSSRALPTVAAEAMQPDRARRQKKSSERRANRICGAPPQSSKSLEEMLASMDRGFSDALLRWIDKKGMTNVECYKKANIDKKLFSKLQNPAYHPSKATVLAFAIALELTLDETKALLETAGLALSRSSRFDVIVEYFIINGKYDLMEINEVLYQYDQNLLGNVIA